MVSILPLRSSLAMVSILPLRFLTKASILPLKIDAVAKDLRSKIDAIAKDDLNNKTDTTDGKVAIDLGSVVWRVWLWRGPCHALFDVATVPGTSTVDWIYVHKHIRT